MRVPCTTIGLHRVDSGGLCNPRGASVNLTLCVAHKDATERFRRSAAKAVAVVKMKDGILGQLV